MNDSKTKNSDPLVTRDGIRVAPGQVWRDLDPRTGGRTKTIKSVDPVMGVVTWDSKPISRVKVKRMYKHSTGWALVQ